MAVGSLQSESQSHVGGTNKFSINRRRRATIAPISLSRRRDGAYRISVVEITLKYATRMTGTRLSAESLKINHNVTPLRNLSSLPRYQDINPPIIVPRFPIRKYATTGAFVVDMRETRICPISGRTIQNSWTRKRSTRCEARQSLFPIGSRVCVRACVRACIDRKTLDGPRGEERKTSTSGLEITNRNWQSRFRFDFLDTVAERSARSVVRLLGNALTSRKTGTPPRAWSELVDHENRRSLEISRGWRSG